MKRRHLLKALFLSAVLFYSFETFAQLKYTSIIAHESQINIDNFYGCPVRYWKNDMSVAYITQNASSAYFCLIKHSDFSNSFAPPAPSPTIDANIAIISTPATLTGLTVNDIYIVDDYAFFCGDCTSTLYGAKAFYGFFDINALTVVPGGVNIYLFLLDDALTKAPVSLEKLVAYRDGGAYKVVAYGNSVPDIRDGCYKVVEVPNATSPSSPIDVADMPISAPPVYLGNKLYIDDIILTKSNVVLLGHDLKTISGILGYPWFAVGRRTSVVADICDPVMNPNYYLPDSTEANDAVKGVALDEDIFAMSYVHVVKPDKYYTRLRVIDYPNLTNPYSQEFQKPSKENPVEMICLGGLKRIELLQRIIDSSNFIQLDPYATTAYNTSMFTPDNREYKSLSPIDGERFISMRSGTVYLEDRTVTLPHSSVSCPQDQPVKVEMIKEMRVAQYPLQGISFTNIFYSLPIAAQVINWPYIMTDCFSFE